MSYQTPITIKQSLERIHRHDYVLPSIQREFVWTPDQVCQLFDSLLRGYPIGTFLFWDVKADTAADFVFYDVMRHFHEAKNRHNPRIDDFTPRPVIAILDGQQRLSALNIGLRGSYTAKVPRKRLDPYPVKRLYLDLCYVPGPEDEVEYRFAFLTEGEADNDPSSEATERWYLVSDILGIDDATDIFGTYIQPQGLGNHATAFKVLNQLHRSVHERPVVAYFVEEEQSLAKVLDIFVRVNSGGTVLSKSDLLLSIATAQFTGRDAREAVHGLVDDLNGISHGFNFSKDMVLKTGMILSGLPDPGFKVENFTKDNMRRLDEAWDSIANSLRLAARLSASFGFSSRTLSGNSVLIPVAHYLHHRGKDEGYLRISNNDDHEVIKGWMLRSLIKPGVWGSGLDTLLKQLMRVIVGTSGPFPVKELEAEMARAGKDLTFTPALIDDLVETPYKNKRVFALLSMLYPGIDVRNEFHEDHVFPKSKFTKANLVKVGIDESEVGEYRDRADRLPNLQLLEGGVNIKKQAMLPLDWAAQHFPNEQARQMWLAGHDLHDLPASLGEFGEFYEARRGRLVHRLRDLLAAAESTAAPTAAEEPSGRQSRADAADGHVPGGRTRRTFARTLPDLVKLGRVVPGEEFTGSYGGRNFRVEVTEDGTLRAGSDVFLTPSGAAKDLTGQVAVNGWAFWRTEDDEPIGDLR